MLYFVPARVAEEYKKFTTKPHKHTMPIIKRKLSAMVKATMWRRELIDEAKCVYQHTFNNIVITVEEKNLCIRDVYKLSSDPERPDDTRSAKYYKYLCRDMGLNSDRTDFSPEYKKWHEEHRQE